MTPSSPREHRMHLYRRYFDLVAQGRKTTEVRVADAARQLLREGDLIRFACDEEEVLTRITRLARYRDFDAMYEREEASAINPTTSEDEQLRGLREIYPPERESLGAVAIGIERVSSSAIRYP